VVLLSSLMFLSSFDLVLKINKKKLLMFAVKEKRHIFALAFELKYEGSVAQLDRASDYGSEG
jgi:hypothetical protein